jgi:hypothetical protein
VTSRRHCNAAWTARGLTIGLIVVPVLSVAAAVRVQEAPGFPHEPHAGLFPLCTGCHAGVLGGAPDETYPPVALCARCHDGVELERVAWQGETRTPGNLVFDHAAHASTLAAVGDPDPGCQGCHASPAERMRVVGLPDPETRCLTCHAHSAGSHLTDATCATCHVTLARSGFSLDRIAGLARPADHDNEAFLAQLHGEAADLEPTRCATCHVRDRCASCHVDSTRAAVRSIAAAPADMTLPSFVATYPRPTTHAVPEWLDAHGAGASRDTCGTCHARNDCAVCHQGSVPAAVQALPERGESAAPGAGSRLTAPASHRTPFFVRDHGGPAGAQASACATCHAGGFCADCHLRAAGTADGVGNGGLPPRVVALLQARPSAQRPVQLPLQLPLQVPLRGGGVGGAPTRTQVAQATEPESAKEPAGSRASFHPPDFALRHTSAAYGQTMECANCHSVEVFCKACHGEVGLTPAARPGPGFHDGGVAWLLGHGQPARQGLESCAGCHRQSDCVQCHSTIGSFRADPHGPGFDAQRGWARAPGTCLVCHLEKPF